MQVALDADILQYEVSFAAEAYWKYHNAELGKVDLNPPSFEIVLDMLEGRVEEIVAEAGGEGPPLLFFTGKTNYRNHIAKTLPYKDREAEKPFHYKNVKAYLQSRFDWVQKEGFEADDLISIWMRNNPGKYICTTRDKDLRQIPGRHYGWELGHQPSFGPVDIDELGFLKLSSGKARKLTGGGLKFFYAQILMGDRVDTIPGIEGLGPVTAWSILSPCETEQELLDIVLATYVKEYDARGMERMLETANLVRMAQEVNEDFTKVKLWNPFQDDIWMDVKTGELSA